MTTYTVTQYDDNVNPNDSLLSVREAIAAAAANREDEDIIILNNVVRLKEPIVVPAHNGRITFQGNGPNTSGFDGQGITQIMLVARANATISNLRLVNGYVKGENGQKGGGGGLGAGGALFIRRGSDVNVDRVEFAGNRVVGGDGGSILQDGGRGGNSVESGKPGFRGGAGLGGAVFKAQGGILRISNSTFRNNSAIGGNGSENGQGRGGGLFADGGFTSNNLTFSDNNASTGDRDTNVAVPKASRGTGTTPQDLGSGYDSSLIVLSGVGGSLAIVVTLMLTYLSRRKP